MSARIREITAAETRPLRQQVLRPHQRAEELVFGGDDSAGSFHAGAFVGEKLVGVATIVPEALAGHDARSWRVRGMATLAEVCGHGHGASLLEACLEHARKQGGAIAWCHARTSAQGFYERAGFVVEGEEFELPAIGPHVVMVKSLSAAR
jgi:ribosomal protein S18 acetylase RimI-like enzyme